ncbi:hypothetical protein GCM10010304_38000 [Streptomyces roseoviolaceus]
MLVRTRGGAVVHGVSYELPLRCKTARHASEKQRIAKAVAKPAAVRARGARGRGRRLQQAGAAGVRPDLRGRGGGHAGHGHGGRGGDTAALRGGRAAGVTV